MAKRHFLIDEIKVQLEWRMSEVMENYPVLTIGEAEQVLEMFYQERHIVIQQGWRIINGCVMKAAKNYSIS